MNFWHSTRQLKTGKSIIGNACFSLDLSIKRFYPNEALQTYPNKKVMIDNFTSGKPGYFRVMGITLLLALSPFLFHQCTQQPQTAYQNIKDTADAVRIINAHEHQLLWSFYKGLPETV